MKKALIIPAVVIALLVGCRPEENREQLKAVNRSLEFANEVLYDVNRLGYEELMAQEIDGNVAFYVEKWRLKAKRIKSFADSVKDLIKNIKSDLITQSDDLKKEDVPLVKQLYDINGLGNRLLNKLIVFKDSCPEVIYSGVDTMFLPILKRGFNNYLRKAPLMGWYGDSLTVDQQHDYKRKWLKESFGGRSTLMSMIMLNKMESDVLTLERCFIDYCKNQRSGGIVEAYTKYMAIATVSSSYVKTGQTIEVYAGLGSFTIVSKPRITINGKEMELSADGTAVYKLVATGNPGKHTIPVAIEFLKGDGSKEHLTKNVRYTIAEN